MLWLTALFLKPSQSKFVPASSFLRISFAKSICIALLKIKLQIIIWTREPPVIFLVHQLPRASESSSLITTRFKFIILARSRHFLHLSFFNQCDASVPFLFPLKSSES